MRSVFFTKPKQLTYQILKYMVEQGEDLLAIVLYGKNQYKDTELVTFARKVNIPIIDYEECDLFFKENANRLQMIWCCTFPKLIKKEWISCASIAAVNFHAAPLPEYRGVFGFNFAILNNEEEFGVTAHLLDSGFDTGEIIEVERFEYDCKHGSVKELVHLSEIHLCLLFKRIYEVYKSQGIASTIIQNSKDGKYYSRKDFDSAKKISFSDSDELVNRKVRAFWYPPYEGAYLEIDGRRWPVITQEILSELGNE